MVLAVDCRVQFKIPQQDKPHFLIIKFTLANSKKSLFL